MKTINEIKSNIILDNINAYSKYKNNWIKSKQELSLYSIIQLNENYFRKIEYCIYIGVDENKKHVFQFFNIINSKCTLMDILHINKKDLKSFLIQYARIPDNYNKLFKYYIKAIKNINKTLVYYSTF